MRQYSIFLNRCAVKKSGIASVIPRATVITEGNDSGSGVGPSSSPRATEDLWAHSS